MAQGLAREPEVDSRAEAFPSLSQRLHVLHRHLGHVWPWQVPQSGPLEKPVAPSSKQEKGPRNTAGWVGAR